MKARGSVCTAITKMYHYSKGSPPALGMRLGCGTYTAQSLSLMIGLAGMDEDISLSRMVNHTLGNGKPQSLMALESVCGQMGGSIKACLERERGLGMEYLRGHQAADMRVNGKRINAMAKEKILGQIHLHLLENISRINLMVGVYSVGRMAVYTKDIGRRTTVMDLARISGRMGGYSRENLAKTVSWQRWRARLKASIR